MIFLVWILIYIIVTFTGCFMIFGWVFFAYVGVGIVMMTINGFLHKIYANLELKLLQ